MTTPAAGANSSTIVIGWGLAVALAVLVVAAVVVTRVAGIGTGRQVATASVRAALQLGIVSVVIVAVVRSLWLSGLFALVMLAVAAFTAGRRMTPDRSGLLAVLPIVLGSTPVIALILVTGTVPVTGIALVPVCGIVIGGAMTATSLCGRRALDELALRHGEYEAALSLGLRERDAAMLLTLPAAGQALVPATDQTRTVGLVTLPGAFVGVLLGGGSPVQAGATQLLVLVALLAAEVVAVVTTAELVARGRIHRRHRVAPRRPRRSRVRAGSVER